jgi:lactoylglutathione lyase
MDEPRVTEMRLVVTASDYEEALRFYRDVLGLPERAAYSSPGGRVSILEAGRATLELADPPHAAYIDEVEVGRRVAGHIRVAFAVADSAAATGELAGAGATVIAEPTRTPWASLNARRPRRRRPRPGRRPRTWSPAGTGRPGAAVPAGRWRASALR